MWSLRSEPIYLHELVVSKVSCSGEIDSGNLRSAAVITLFEEEAISKGVERVGNWTQSTWRE